MKNIGLLSALMLVVSFNVNAVLIADGFNGAYRGVRSTDSMAVAPPLTLTLGEGEMSEILGDSRKLSVKKTSTAGNPPAPAILSLFKQAACDSSPDGTRITKCGVGGAVVLTDLTAIDILFESDDLNIDLVMDNVKFVLAPKTLALLGFGLLSFAFVSRRKVRFTLQAKKIKSKDKKTLKHYY